MRKFFDTCSARDVEKLQALGEEAEQFRDLKPVKSCLFNKRQQWLTDERIAEFRLDMEMNHQEPKEKDFVLKKSNMNIDCFAKKLAEIRGESEQFQDLKPVKSCLLNKIQQWFIDERVANADGNIEELQRVKRELFCVMIEEVYTGLK